VEPEFERMPTCNSGGVNITAMPPCAQQLKHGTLYAIVFKQT